MSKNMFPADRVMATVSKITDIGQVPESKKFLTGKIGGYTIVFNKKLNIMENTFVLHILPDSYIDNLLKKILEHKNTTDDDKELLLGLLGKHTRMYKIHNVMNYGLIFNLDHLAKFDIVLEKKEQSDMTITKLFQIQKYVSDHEIQIYKNQELKFPSNVPRTDEPRIQGKLDLIELIKKEDECVFTEKADGMSCTIIYDNKQFKVCSRNYELRDDNKSAKKYFEIVKKYEFQNKLEQLNTNIAIQGEIVGPSIANNSYKLKELALYVFSIYDIDKKMYYHYDDMQILCSKLELPLVREIYRGKYMYNNIEELLDFTKTIKYTNGHFAEGIVVRSLTKHISFKIINPNYKIS